MNLNEINKSEFEAPIKRITSPMTPWQVYELGMTINSVTAKIYHLLAENCTDPEMVDNILKNNQNEANALEDKISLHLTNEMVDYYGSRGRIRHGIEGEVNQATYDNFDNDAKTFLIQFDRFLERIKQKNTPFNTEEIEKICSEITNDICYFYQAIIDLYPQGETSDAVKDIYELTFDAYKSRLQ